MVVVGAWVSVLFFGLAGGLLVFVFVARGREVVDELVFCAAVNDENASTSEISNIVLCDITFLLWRPLRSEPSS